MSYFALGTIVFTSRKHVIALEPRDNGMVGVTLRYPYEVRDPQSIRGHRGRDKFPVTSDQRDLTECLQPIEEHD